MNNTISFDTTKTIEQMSHKIDRMDATVTNFFDTVNHILNQPPESDAVYLAAVAPDMELTVILPEDAADILPCFDEADQCFEITAETPVLACYDPRQVIILNGKHHLCGPVVFTRIDENGDYISLTTKDLYAVQTFLEQHSITLMEGRNKLPCICMD